MFLLKSKTSRKPASQSSRILQQLKKSGNHGSYNYELSKICLSWHRRVGNLRADGHNIQSVHIKGSGWKYYLNPEDK